MCILNLPKIMSLQLTITVLCLLGIFFKPVRTQSIPNIDVLLGRIFDDNSTELIPETRVDTSAKICGFGKECVPRSLCNENGTVNIYGIDMLNLRIDGSNPCAYLESCCDVSNKLQEPKPLDVPQRNTCGYRNFNGVSFKITDAKNNEAEFAEFPWMVAIYANTGNQKVFKCGGSIIAPNVILTAAHCLSDKQTAPLMVRAGEWDLETTQEPLMHQDARVSEIIVHESFSRSTIFNDIALLILETPFTFAPNVQPICLPEAGTIFDNKRCFATGWGQDKFGKHGAYQHILKKIELPVIPHAKCQTQLRVTRLSRYFQLHNSFMCAGGELGKDTCKGDGGSPLSCPDPNNPERYLQAGVVSWGIECGVENIPGVYANVAQLREWIIEKLVAKGIDTKFFTP
ncbi:phenoloxidase-activating factor 2-like [Bactrocera neohumeralis]|uniref:phenoloxidase-activating factor 2-like n=1 Tax=Bactrocera neohumeralis TaxID=98809 RepID=UPI002166A68D|nr:phenoloxidase-activating factor 2-like [Bactrocera neohumeralis]